MYLYITSIRHKELCYSALNFKELLILINTDPRMLYHSRCMNNVVRLIYA